MPDDFVWIRPYWLLALLPLAALVFVASRHAATPAADGWRRLVDAHLLEHLMTGSDGERRPRWLPPAALALAVAIVALAGPSVEGAPLAEHRSAEPSVIVLSLAQSMNATDVAPSRLVRAGHKVRDLLARARGGDIGFVIYADRPFVAAPLTADGRVIAEMLSELSTDLMPVLGDRPDLAIAEAANLLERAGATRGRILLIADDAGDDASATVAAAKAAAGSGYRVSVLGVGTPAGAPLRTASGQSITHDGAAPITRLATDELSSLARDGGGAFATVTADEEDLDTVLPSGERGVAAGASEASMAATPEAGTRVDAGYWLLLLPLALAPFAFRRKLLLVLPIALTLSVAAPVPEASAAWSELWRTPDQRGAEAFGNEAFDVAADMFEDPAWQASALYRAGRYEQAAERYGGEGSVDRDYNRGNALARAGRLEASLEAYDAALALDPEDDDAIFNRELVARLLEERSASEQQTAKGEQGGPNPSDGADRQAATPRQGNGQDAQPDQSPSAPNGQEGQEGQDDPQSRSGDKQNGQQGDQQSDQQSDQQGDQQGDPQSAQQSDEQGDQQGDQQSGQRSDQQGGQQGAQAEQQGTSARSDGQPGAQEGQPKDPRSGQPDSPPSRSDARRDEQARESPPGRDDPQRRQGEREPRGETGQPHAPSESTVAGDEPAGESVPDTAADKSAAMEEEGGAHPFRDAIDNALRANDAKPAERADTGAGASSPSRAGSVALDQASEQELRSVPDDPSGLLRARIRRYYATGGRG